MNQAVIYTNPSAYYATPVASTGGNLAILQQPIYGEQGYDPRRRPRVHTSRVPFEVTFENNVVIPDGAPLWASIRSVVLTIVGPPGVNLWELVDIGRDGSNTTQYRPWGYPRAYADRTAKRIRTLSLEARFGNTNPGGAGTVTVQAAAGVGIGPMRATYMVHD